MGVLWSLLQMCTVFLDIITGAQLLTIELVSRQTRQHKFSNATLELLSHTIT